MRSTTAARVCAGEAARPTFDSKAPYSLVSERDQTCLPVVCQGDDIAGFKKGINTVGIHDRSRSGPTLEVIAPNFLGSRQLVVPEQLPIRKRQPDDMAGVFHLAFDAGDEHLVAPDDGGGLPLAGQGGLPGNVFGRGPGKRKRPGVDRSGSCPQECRPGVGRGAGVEASRVSRIGIMNTSP